MADPDARIAVIDIGSRNIRAGFAGDTVPTVQPNIVAHPKRKSFQATANTPPSSSAAAALSSTFIGRDAQERQAAGTHILKYPVEYGTVTNWDDMEKVWSHILHTELGIDPEECCPVMFTEAPLTPRANREKMTQIMFETFGVPAMYLAVQSVMVLLAAGRSTGCVFESGGGMSIVLPVYEGHAIPHLARKFMVSGEDVTYYLAKLLHEKSGITATTTADMRVVRQVKEKMCYVATDLQQEVDTYRGLSAIDSGFTLPDGQVVSIGEERFQAPEVIFNPTLYGLEYSGAPDTICSAIRRCDVDLQQDMFRNVCLSGGNTIFPGLQQRLQREIQSLAPDQEVEVIGAPDRALAAWRGASMFASHPDFLSSIAITKDEYDEYGPRTVHWKCF